MPHHSCELFPPFNGKLKQKAWFLHAFAASQSVQGVKNDLTVSHPSQLEDPHYGVRFIYVYVARERDK